MFIPTTLDSPSAVYIPGGLAITTVPVRASASTVGIHTDENALAANSNRAGWSITNMSTIKLYVRLGTGASATNFDAILVGCQAPGDGLGGFYSDSVYTGIVTVFSTAAYSYNTAERSFDISVSIGTGTGIGGGTSGGTTDSAFDYRAANSSIPVISSDPTALAANSLRKAWSIVNMGTNPLYIRAGDGCTLVPPGYDHILLGGVANDDGYGMVYGDSVYTGIVTIAGTSPRYIATERY